MKNNLLVFFAFLLITTNVKVFAADANKSNGWCGSSVPSMEWEDQIQRIIQTQQAQNNANGREQQVAYTIPVIVHICYYQNTTAQNISAARVQSQITTLNSDFAGTGVNSSTLPAPFAAVKANSNITFCLAKLGLNNNILAEPGIERINGTTRGWPNPASTTGWSRDFIDGTIKKTTIWDPNYYLNIWVVPYIAGINSGILGYATFPGLTGLQGMPSGAGDETNDGFVCRASYFGTNGSNIGRTSTHEIGHWLGLRHIWGDDGQCNADDFCNDTPKQYGGTLDPAGCNYGCPTYPANANLCNNNPNGDMFMNFMDYTNDNCMALFTNDQSARFQATMQFGDFRKNLKNSPVCDTVLQKPVAKFSYLKQNAALCATTQKYDFTDKSLFLPTSWSWSFQGGTPATSILKNPTNITFTTRGLHDVTLTVTNARGSSTNTFQINVPIVGTSTLPLVEDFESIYFPPLGWDIVNRNGNAAINWDIMNGYSGFGVGNRCMRFDNTTLDARFFKDDIMTSKFDLTGATLAKVKFDVAYAPFFGDAGLGVDQFLWDTLEVLITDNCQSTTQRIYRKGETDLATFAAGIGSEFYPTADQWRTDSITIPAGYLNKPNVQIIFRNYGDYGHTIYVDNINVWIPNSLPTATASFTASDTTVCIGSTLTFTNTSTASVGSPDSVRWTIPGGTPSTSTSATTVTPTFNTAGTYVISLIAYKSGNASTAFTKSIRVKANATATLTSAAGTNAQTKCAGTAITNITYAIGGSGTGAGVTGLPTGVTGTFAGGVFTISGTPTATGTFNYTVTTTGTCVQATATGSIVVNPNAAIALTSAAGTNAQTRCSGVAITNITYSVTGGGTGAGVTGLPAGVTGSFAGGVFTISGTPTATGTFNYTVTTTGTCTQATATGSIVVNPNATIALTSAAGTNAQTLCVGTAITNITYSVTGGGTGAGVTGLPTGVTGAFAGGVFTISGTPSATGTFNYTVTTTGNCTQTTATGTITVNTCGCSSPPTVTLSSTSGSTCVVTPITVSGNTFGGSATSVTLTENGTGSLNISTASASPFSFTYTPGTGESGSITITVTTNNPNGSPCVAGTSTYTLTLTPAIGNPVFALGSSSARCQAANTVTYTATSTNSTGITYSLDATSITGGNTINSSTGVVTYAAGWNGTTTITASATGCGGPKTSTHTVTVNATPATPTITQSNDTLNSSTVVVGASYEWYLGASLVATTSVPYYKFTVSGSYTVKVIKNSCPSALSAAFPASATGVRNNSNSVKLFEVYPNPTEGRLVMNLNLYKTSSVNISIYTPEGREVYVKAYGNTKALTDELNMKDFANGIYIIKLRVDDETYYHKVVKN